MPAGRQQGGAVSRRFFPWIPQVWHKTAVTEVTAAVVFLVVTSYFKFAVSVVLKVKGAFLSMM